MITKLRDQAIRKLAGGFGLCFLGLVMAAVLQHTSARRAGFAACVILGIVGMLIYLFGLVDFAKAKGYSSAIVAAVIAVSFVCLPVISIFVVTLVVLFALKDKTARHRKQNLQHPTPNIQRSSKPQTPNLTDE